MLNHSHFRLSKRKLCGLFLIALVTAVGIYGPWIKVGLDFRRYHDLHDDVTEIIQQTTMPPPTDVDPIIWSNVVQMTDSAFGNIFFTSENASFDELQSFANDLRRSAHLEPRAKLKWIWKRLEAVKGRHVSTILKNTRLLLGEDAVLTMSPGPDWHRYSALRDEVKRIIREMSDAPPANVDRIVWSEVIHTTDEVFGTVFFLTDDASYAELVTFAQELHQSEQLGPSARLKWIWKRLEAVNGDRVADRLKLFREALGKHVVHTLDRDGPETPVDHQQDANWNMTAVTNASGTVQERYVYSAYGVPIFLDAAFSW